MRDSVVKKAGGEALPHLPNPTEIRSAEADFEGWVARLPTRVGYCLELQERAMNNEPDPEAKAGIAVQIYELEKRSSPAIEAVGITSETGTLRAALVGIGETLCTGQSQAVLCKGIDRAIEAGRLPPIEQWRNGELRDHILALSDQLDALANTLRREGVQVYRPFFRSAQEQLFARDPIIIIDDKLIFAQMGREERMAERYGIAPHFAAFPKEKILYLPSGAILEGGDVMPQNRHIFAGLNGPRTNGAAVNFLETNFREFNVVPVELASPNSSEDVLHLDCCLNFAGHDIAVVYPGGMRAIPDEIRHRFRILEVDRDEQLNLGTNFLSVSPTRVIASRDTPRINQKLNDAGIEIIEVDLSLVKLWGGFVRCSVNALRRDEVRS